MDTTIVQRFNRTIGKGIPVAGNDSDEVVMKQVPWRYTLGKPHATTVIPGIAAVNSIATREKRMDAPHVVT
jgi:hypothetical protein